MIEGPLAEVLARDRDRYNARFAAARAADRRLAPEAFLRFLAETLDPLVRAAARADPSRIDVVVEALYDLSLKLMDKDCLGPSSRRPLIGEAWQRLLPRIAGLLVRDPGRVAGAVSNALFHLAEDGETAAARWLAEMERLAPLCPDPDIFLAAGQVAAWRSGQAQYRESALTVWRGLPDDLKYETLGLRTGSGPSPAELEQRLADPWQDPARDGRAEKTLALTARLGGFRGFGGVFLQPPRIASSNGSLIARDDRAAWLIFADRFGATLRRWDGQPPDGQDPEGEGDFKIEKHSGRIAKGGLEVRFEALAGPSSFASTTSTLALTLPLSHYVFLVAEV
ncbi:MAG: hypothetical protein KKB20_08295 [Proteobacteria bacterium]|nr:hypothetical protein [Pseudomonadota bacterium]